MKDVRIHEEWKKALDAEFHKSYWQELTSFVRNEYLSQTVYPPPHDIFRAFDLCPFNSVKVVIIGQDPYHGPKQANGLCFAVHDGITVPPSLKNIYKEIKNDLGITPHLSGDLTRWATQGVLMLNSVLTVLASTPASHKGKGWETFTDAVISQLNHSREYIVYILWGKYAQAKGALINRDKNLVLESGHPSPFSANLFFGHHHFKKCNEYLESHGVTAIDWR